MQRNPRNRENKNQKTMVTKNSNEAQGPRKPRQIRDTKSHQLLDEVSQTSSKRFGEDIGILSFSRDILKTQNLSFNEIPNEVISNLYVLSLRMLNRVFRYINSTRVIIVNNHGILGYPIIS